MMAHYTGALQLPGCHGWRFKADQSARCTQRRCAECRQSL